MTKNIAKSIKARLLIIAKKENLNYQLLIIRYLYERLLYRLSVSQYKNKFCLKGGALLYAFEKDFPRPTLDIDFLGMKIKNDIDTINRVFGEILAIPCDDGILFDMPAIQAEEINESKSYQGTHPLFTESFMNDKSRNIQWKRFLKKIRQDENLSFEDVMILIRSKLNPIYQTLNTDKK